MSPATPDDFLAEQLAWMRAGKRLYVEWKSRRGSFFGNLCPRAGPPGTEFRLVGRQDGRFFRRSDGKSTLTFLPGRDIRETFRDDGSLLSFLRLNYVDPRLWRLLAQLRDGQTLRFSWGCPENFDQDMGAGSFCPSRTGVEFRGHHNSFPGDGMNPAEDFCHSYRVDRVEDDRLLASALRRCLAG